MTTAPLLDATTAFVRAPAPGRLPLLGHLPRIAKDPLGFFASLRGHGDIVMFGLGPATVYQLTHPDLIRRVLVNDVRKFDKGVQYEKARAVVGNGLLSSSEPLHLRQRRLIQPAFHHTRIADYAEDMRRIAVERIESWPPGREFRQIGRAHV